MSEYVPASQENMRSVLTFGKVLLLTYGTFRGPDLLNTFPELINDIPFEPLPRIFEFSIPANELFNAAISYAQKLRVPDSSSYTAHFSFTPERYYARPQPKTPLDWLEGDELNLIAANNENEVALDIGLRFNHRRKHYETNTFVWPSSRKLPGDEFCEAFQCLLDTIPTLARGKQS